MRGGHGQSGTNRPAQPSARGVRLPERGLAGAGACALCADDCSVLSLGARARTRTPDLVGPAASGRRDHSPSESPASSGITSRQVALPALRRALSNGGSAFCQRSATPIPLSLFPSVL